MSQEAISGYETLGPEWIEKSEAIDPKTLYAFVLDLLPEDPSGLKVLDLGAASGRDAAWLACRAAVVTAVEPAANLRSAGQARHKGIPIKWIDDRLPDLLRIDDQFDLILATGVWQHLDEAEQRLGFQRVARLLQPGGRLVLALRHGAAADHHTNFAIDVDALLTWAAALDLIVLRQHETRSLGDWNRTHGVTWTWLVLENRIPA